MHDAVKHGIKNAIVGGIFDQSIKIDFDKTRCFNDYLFFSICTLRQLRDCQPGCSVLDWIVCINGLYDIMCAVGILFLPNTVGFTGLAKLHPTMFRDPAIQDHPIVRRLLAYWLITYGCVRMAVFNHDMAVDFLAASTYFIEAWAYAYEDLAYETTIRAKVAWVSWSSVVLGLLIFFRPVDVYYSLRHDWAVPDR